jgi:hypothetical protein
MWYSKSENIYIKEGYQFTLDGITYPPQWMYQATLEQKKAIGLEEVITVGERKSDKFYWVGEHLEGATLTYVNTPKDLDVVKQSQIAELKQLAYALLLPSDWMVVRSAETGNPLDENWKNYRQEIRDKTAQYAEAIEAADDVDQIAELQYEWPEDPTV